MDQLSQALTTGGVGLSCHGPAALSVVATTSCAASRGNSSL